MSSASREKTIQQIIDVTMRSAKAREINIIEIGNLNDLISREAAEMIRKEFVKYNTPIKQITNLRKLVNWTANTGMVQNLAVKYVPEETYKISNEILLFEDTVAVYRLDPDPFYLEVNDASFAATMRATFTNLWQLGDNLLLSADGSTHTKQYLPITFSYKHLPVVMYLAKDDGVLEKAFSRDEPGSVEQYIGRILASDAEFYDDSDMVLAYVWNQEATPCCDVWKISRNDISDDSGFLYDVRIYKGTDIATDMGVASGNSSIVITAEEMLLRDLVIDEGLSFAEAANRKLYHARFPVGFVPAEDFYTHDKGDAAKDS